METDRDELLDARYVRWQGLSIAQLTVAIGLISAWSAGAVVYGISLLRSPPPHPCGRGWLIGALVLLLVSSALSFLSVVSRTLDFKLTARAVRKRISEKRGRTYDKSTEILGLTHQGYGRLTWALFSSSAALFAIGMSIFSICVGVNYLAP